MDVDGQLTISLWRFSHISAADGPAGFRFSSACDTRLTGVLTAEERLEAIEA